MWGGESLLPENAVVGQLRERLDQWGIEAVASDLDDTLIDTRRVFSQAMFEAARILLSGKIAPEVKEELRQPRNLKELFMDEVVDGLQPELGVLPAIMELTVLITAKRLGLNLNSPAVKQAVARIQQIYGEDIPVLFQGAIEVIDLINATGVRSILMTHASEEWTWAKRTQAGLMGKFGQVVCFSTLQPKSWQWEDKLGELGVDPSKLLVIGNSLAADIIPPVGLGARAIWVTRRSGAFTGEPSQSGTLDEETFQKQVLKVDRIEEVIGAILATARP